MRIRYCTLSGSDGTSTSGGMLGSSGGPGPSVTSGLTATLGSSAGDASGVVVGSGLGVIPPSSAIPWVPLLTSNTSASVRHVVQPATATTSAATTTCDCRCSCWGVYSRGAIACARETGSKNNSAGVSGNERVDA